MFAEQKKDYYSVNADIAIEANQQQRNHEYGTRAHMIQSEYAQLGVSGQYDDSQGQDGYGMDPGYQQELANQQNMQLGMLDETMNGPQAVRYDEVYYPRTDKRSIKGNQYTYQGNDYNSVTQNKGAVADMVSMAIENQEIGKSPIEYTNQLSRAKVFDMKNIRVPEQVRSYNNLYQDSIPQSTQHEIQRYGKRAPGLDSSKRVNKATFMNQIMEKQQQAYMQMHQMQQQVEPVEEQQAEDDQQQAIQDAASAATEHENEGGEGDTNAEWAQVIDNLWNEYDQDNSGFLDREEMVPLAQAALAQIGFTQQLDAAVIDAFFVEIDNDGNGKIDKSELQRFMQSLI